MGIVKTSSCASLLITCFLINQSEISRILNQPIRVQYIPGEEEVFMVIHVIIVRVLHPDPEWFRRLAVNLANEN